MANHSHAARNGASLFLSFLACCFLFVIFIMIISLNTFMSSRFLLQQYNNSRFYQNVVEELQEQYEALGIPANIPQTVFEEALQSTQLYTDVTNSIKAAYDGKEFQVDKVAFTNKFYAVLEAYAIKQGIKITDDVEYSLRHLTDICFEQYDKMVFNDFILIFCRISGGLRGLIIGALVVAIALLLIVVFLLFRIHEWKHRPVRYLNYSLLGCGLMLIVFPSIVYFSKIINRLGITSKSLFHFIQSYANNVLFYFIITGAVLMLAALTVGLIVCKMMKER